jgi:DNA-binding XRE family transcriptional regulator
VNETNRKNTSCFALRGTGSLRDVGTRRVLVVRRYIAANVKRLRLKNGLTQEALAEHAGIEPRYLQDVEKGRTNLSLAVLVGLAEALEVDERELLRPARLAPSKAGRPKRPQDARASPGAGSQKGA